MAGRTELALLCDVIVFGLLAGVMRRTSSRPAVLMVHSTDRASSEWAGV